MLDILYSVFLDTGNNILSTWIGVFIVWTSFVALSRIFSQVKTIKIQKRKYRSVTFRHEIMWSAINIGITGFVLTQFGALMVDKGWLISNPEPAAWYVVVIEFALYFFIFDLYFYGIHWLIHKEPLYKWIHKTHHFSTSPNPLSSSSMTPIEGIAEGFIVPLFMTVFTVHETTAMFIIPFATLMGLYVHCGYEFLPRWWYKSRLTNWFITPMFHDQHHQYFTCNYGAYTTIWDRVFGTVRPRFEQDFDKLKARAVKNELPAS
ncbi:sterol desaturase family protein [Halioxenophilus sp. WMMB6]|uniref:sterol desaturase family protein n=1 Tax=Halioxenophilus sp. WMMB6 TaxID=3073815 RepID=UPI00295F1FAB|nr:sterol desaturase family protein [Halioxenophilus sp. WMMB6]